MKIRINDFMFYFIYAIMMLIGFAFLIVGLTTDTLYGTLVGFAGLLLLILGIPFLMMFSTCYPEYDADELIRCSKNMRGGQNKQTIETFFTIRASLQPR